MKIAVAHVAGLYNYPGVAGAQFTEGCAAIWATGVRTLKVWCTSAYLVRDYPRQTWGAVPTTMTELLETAPFQTEFDRGWDEIVIVGYTFANNVGGVVTNQWRVDPSAAFMAAEFSELKEAGEYLLTRLDGTGTNATIQNWEGDWSLMDSEGAPDTRVTWQQIQNYCSFLGTRQRAVEAARRSTPSTCRLLHAIEANRVVDTRLFPHRPRVAREIARRVQPDVISFSAYDATIVDQGGWGADLAAWTAATTPVFTKALRFLRQAFPHSLLYIGEFGFPEGSELPVGRNVGAMVEVIYNIALAQGVSVFTYWQVFGNDETSPGSGIPRLFATHLPDGTLTSAGNKLVTLAP